MFEQRNDIMIGRRLFAAVLLCGAVFPLEGCEGDMTTSQEQKYSNTGNRKMSADGTRKQEPGSDVQLDKSTMVVDRQLNQLLSNSKFKPELPASIASKFFFNVSGEVIYSTSGEGIVYHTRYYSILGTMVCIYDDKDKNIKYECIKIFKKADNLYNFEFLNNNKLNNSVVYIKYSEE